MIFGVDCRQVYDVSTNRGAGVERFVFHLTRQLLKADSRHEWRLFFNAEISPETIRRIKGKNERVKVIKIQNGRLSWPVVGRHWRFARWLAREKMDACLFPTGSVPLFYRGKAIVVCHDLAIYLRPEWFPGGQWFARRLVVPFSLRRAEKVVAVSVNTRRDLMKIFSLPAAKIVVIAPGVAVKADYAAGEFAGLRRKYDLPEKYFLFLGTLEPRKNLVFLMRGFVKYALAHDSRAELVLAGEKGWKYRGIFEEMARLNRQLRAPRIKYLGRVNNRERNLLLKNAVALVYPSLYEGFGLPPAEAMAMGTPAVVGANSALVELAAEGGALAVETESEAALASALRLIETDATARNELIKNGHLTVGRLTWERAAKEYLNLFSGEG